MSAKYYCDKCGTELYWWSNDSAWNVNKVTIGNTDGYKTFDPKTGELLDLCNECRKQLLNENKEILDNFVK